jgi:RND family efflux transporter MFP subunit
METEKLKPLQSGVTKPKRGRVAPPLERRAGRKTTLLMLFALIIAGAAGVFLVLKSRGINVQPASQPVVVVAAARVTRQDVYDEVPIPAEFRPYVESELHAMVTGYVSQMNVDFGDKVKQGQVLATLEVPELFDQLHNAQATEQQAEADRANAHLIYTRLLEVNRQTPHAVAQQDIDTAQSKDASAAATVAAAKADVEKYQTLVNYTKITAPFDGVITQRSADPGALVQAGTSSDRSMPLVRVSDNYHLRLDFPVSVEYVKDVHMGDPVTVRVDSLGGKIFVGNPDNDH